MTTTDKPRYASLGSVSKGTMKPEDLIPTFASRLNALYTADSAPNDFAKGALGQADGYDPKAWSPERAAYLLDVLADALNEYAPPLCRFGAHEGDGADYGFWLAVDLHDHDALRDQNVLVVDELPEGSCDRFGQTCDYWLVVSDHGNATLYDAQGREIWSVA